jgi:hypothetical protein
MASIGVEAMVGVGNWIVESDAMLLKSVLGETRQA